MNVEKDNSQAFFNREDRFTSSAVGQLAKSGNSECLLHSIQKGCPSDISDNRGWFPIHEAANSGHNSCVEILLKHCKRDFKNTKTFNGETPLFLAASNGYPLVMRTLLLNGADISISNNEMITVLVAAVKGRNKECVQICIDNRVDLNSQDAGGWTALHEAAFLGEEACLQLLISAGAKIKIRNSDGATALFVAAQYGHTHCLRTLIKNKGNVNLGTKDKATPVFIASQEGHTDCLKALIDAGADVKRKTTDLTTPLHTAAERGCIECARLLIKAGADVNAKCIEGKDITPLHLAASEDQVECLIELIEAGACMTAEFKEERHTPLELAASCGGVKCCEELIKRGCDPNRSFVSSDSLEETTLLCAVDTEELECLEILLKYGADPNKEFYSYPIIVAAKNTSPECLHMLLKYGANVDVRDKVQNTALNLSVTRYLHLSTNKSEDIQLECIKILLKASADVSVLFEVLRGALSASIIPVTRKGISPELIKLLLLFGANDPQMKKIITCNCHDDDPEWRELRGQYETPSKLVDLCRLVIRKRMGKTRITRVSELPIPLLLQQFVDFHDL